MDGVNERQSAEAPLAKFADTFSNSSLERRRPRDVTIATPTSCRSDPG